MKYSLNRSYLELAIVLIADVVLYFKIDNVGFDLKGLFTIFLSIIAFVATIAGFVSLIIDVDKWIVDNKPTFFKGYSYLKIFLGILFVIFAVFLLSEIAFDHSSLDDFIYSVLGIVFVGLFLYIGGVLISKGYKNLKEQ
ncbi:hypothetical protein [Nitratifractor sp.]